MASTTPQPPSPYGALSDAKVNKLADQRVNAALAALSAPIKSAQATAARKALGDETAAMGTGTALSGILQGVGPGMQQAYEGGAQEIGQLAGGLSGAAGDRLSAQQDQNRAFLEANAHGGNAAPGVNTNDLHDALYGLEGLTPGSSLAEHGAAAGAWGAALPGIQAIKTQEDVRAARSAAAEKDAEYEQQLLDTAAKRPDLKNQILDQLTQHELDKLNARLQIGAAAENKREFGVTQQTSRNQFAATQAEQRRQDAQNARQFGATQAQSEQQFQATQDLNAQQLAETERANKASEANQTAQITASSAHDRAALRAAQLQGQLPDATLSKAYGYVVDSYGTPILNAKGKRIPAVVGRSSSPTVVKHKAYQSAVKGAVSIKPTPVSNPLYLGPGQGQGKYLAKKGAKGVFDPGTDHATTNNPKLADSNGQYTFAEAQSYLISAYGVTRAQARKALVASGWKPDGKRPRKK